MSHMHVSNYSCGRYRLSAINHMCTHYNKQKNQQIEGGATGGGAQNTASPVQHQTQGSQALAREYKHTRTCTYIRISIHACSVCTYCTCTHTIGCVTHTYIHVYTCNIRTYTHTHTQAVEKPTLRAIRNLEEKGVYVIQSIGTNYSDFGIFLLDDPNGAKVDEIKENNRGICTKINEEIIKLWLKGGEKGSPVTWDTLLSALGKAKLCTLEEDLKAAISQ